MGDDRHAYVTILNSISIDKLYNVCYSLSLHSPCNNRLTQGRIQDFGKGGGGGGGGVSTCTKTQHFRTHARDIFPPLYDVWGSPKRVVGGGGG